MELGRRLVVLVVCALLTGQVRLPLRVAGSVLPVTPSVSGPTTMYTQSQRNAKNQYWFDGLIGVSTLSGGNYTNFGAVGTEGGTYQTLKGVGPGTDIANATTLINIGNKPSFAQYMSGGPVVDVGSSTLAMVVHYERWPAGGAVNFYATLGIATSTDAGATWNSIGEFLTPSYAYDSGQTGTDHYQDIAGGPLVPVGLYYYLYFREYTGAVSFTDSYISVARCLITDFNSAVLGSTAPTFDKWQGSTTWGGSNLGSQIATLDSNLVWGDVQYDSHFGVYLLCARLPAAGHLDIYGSLSTDGITWGTLFPIADDHDVDLVYSVLFPAAITGNRSGIGPWIMIYETEPRWSATQVRWRTVTLSR